MFLLPSYSSSTFLASESGKVTPVFDPQPPLLSNGSTIAAANGTITPSPGSKPSRYQCHTESMTSFLVDKTICADPIRGDCHPNAECAALDNGKHECQCQHGFTGDGRNCQGGSAVTALESPYLPIPVPDINECALRLVKCHPLAECINTIGSHLCLCPQGYRGDGVQTCAAKNETESQDRLDGMSPSVHHLSQPRSDSSTVSVECQDDGIVLLYVHKGADGTSANFNGRIFVKTQSQNPYCGKDFTSSDGPVYKFKAPFAYCDVKTEPHVSCPPHL